jgi:Zn-dependent protease with chaperone function
LVSLQCRTGARQFPDLHALITSHAARLGLSSPPTAYVLESGGVMNAFAARLLGRTFIIINADVLSLVLRRGTAAVSFIVGHELGHHWRGHLKWNWLIAPARVIPYLGSAYSRALRVHMRPYWRVLRSRGCH